MYENLRPRSAWTTSGRAHADEPDASAVAGAAPGREACRRAARGTRARSRTASPRYRPGEPELRAYFERRHAPGGSLTPAAQQRQQQLQQQRRSRRLSFRRVAPNGPQGIQGHLVGGTAPLATPDQPRPVPMRKASVLTPRSQAFATLSDIANGGSGGGRRARRHGVPGGLTGFHSGGGGGGGGVSGGGGSRPASASLSSTRASSRATTPSLPDHYVTGSVSRSSTPRSDANHAPTPSHAALSKPSAARERATTGGGGGAGGGGAFFANPVPVKDTPPPANARSAPTPPPPQEP